MGSFTIVTEPAAGVETGNVVFVADKKAETSAALLDQIAEKSGKGRGLVAADLESYLEQMRQFINIGKPYVIEDVGVVSLNKNGNYEFSRTAGGNTLPPAPVHQEQHFLPESGGGNTRAGKRNGIMGLAAVIILLVVAGVGYGIYNMVRNGKSSTDTTEAETVTTPPAADTTSVAATPPADSAGAKPDSVVTPATPPTVLAAVSKDSARYRFIFETTASSERAHTRTAQLQSFGDPAGFDSSKQEDGTFTYRLYLRQKIAIADSAKAKDSVQLYLSKSVRAVRE